MGVEKINEILENRKIEKKKKKKKKKNGTVTDFSTCQLKLPHFLQWIALRI